MTLPSSGQLKLSDIQAEFGGTSPISMSEYYAGGGNVPSGTGSIPTTGVLAASAFRGTAAYTAPDIVIIALGIAYAPSAAYSNLTNIYNLTDDTRTSGSTLLANRYTSSAVGTSTVAHFLGGYNGAALTSVDKYTYQTSVVSAGTALTSAMYSAAGIGNTTVGITAGGAAANTNTVKYTYASNTTAAGSSISIAGNGPAPASVAAYGLIAGGGDGASALYSTNRKYAFATNTVTNTGALGTARRSLAGAGNTSYAVFSGGYTTTIVAATDRFNHSSGTCAAGTTLSAVTYWLGGSGNATTALFAAVGSSTAQSVTNKFNFAAGTRTTGTSLSNASSGASLTSPRFGGLL